jgi:hypothetical protein
MYSCSLQVLEFVDEHGNEVLNLGSFTLLPQHVVRLILAREELHADEFTKFQAALMWSKKYCDTDQVCTKHHYKCCIQYLDNDLFLPFLSTAFRFKRGYR